MAHGHGHRGLQERTAGPDQQNRPVKTPNNKNNFCLMEETASSTPSTTSTVRRFWALSPPSSPLSRFSATPSSGCPSSSSSSSASFASSRTYTSPQYAAVTYIPPLVDAANGTQSRRQRRSHGSALLRLKYLVADIHALVAAAPEFVRVAKHQAMAPLRSVVVVLASQSPLAVSVDDMADAAEALLQLWLAALQLGTLAALPLLFLCLPGIVFCAWLAACLVCIRIASWPLNSGSDCRTGTVFQPPWRINHADNTAPSGSDDSDQPNSAHWFFVSGIGATSRTLSKTAPRVAGVFGHPVTLVRPHTYGAAADFLLSAVLHRLCDRQLPHADALYDMLYPLLVAESLPPRVVVVAHNTGASAVAQALVRLLVDVPAPSLARLEIYTFGSLASEFVLPRGMALATSRTPTPPHIEHIAHVDDPCARLGVLQSIRHDLTGRYCGGAFVLGETRSAAAAARSAPPTPVSATAPTQPSVGVKSRRDCRKSFPFTNQQLQYLQQQQQQQQQQPCRIRTASGSSSDSAAPDFAHSQPPPPPPSYPSSIGSYASSLCAASHENLNLNLNLLLPQQTSFIRMEAYLTALFGPEPWSMRPDLADIDAEFVDMDMEGTRCRRAGSSSSSSSAPFLDAEISVDRELAEKREMAAIEAAARDWPVKHARSTTASLAKVSAKDAHFRLSWTGLGATAKFGTASAGTSIRALSTHTKTKYNPPADTTPSSQLEGLEMARRLCKAYDGRPARDVSVLAGYFADAVARHREMFDF